MTYFGFVRAGGVLLAGATGVLVAGAAGLVAVLLATSLVEFVGLAASTMLFAICSGYTHALNCLFNAARIRSVVAVGAGFEAVGRIAMVAGVIAYVGPTSTAVMIGYAGAAAPLLLVQLALATRLIRRRIITEVSASAAPWVRQMWIFSWPLMAAGVFNWAYFASQRWSLELFVSTAEVGRFYALTQVASAPVAVAGSLLMTTIQPVLYSRMGDPSSSLNREYVRRALRLVVRLGLLGTLALVIAAATLHDWAYRILVSSDYSELSSLLPAVVAATSLLQVSIALGSYIAITNNTRAGLVKDVVGNAAVAAINMLFTYLAGVHGLVAGMVVGALIHLSWTYRVVSRLK